MSKNTYLILVIIIAKINLYYLNPDYSKDSTEKATQISNILEIFQNKIFDKEKINGLIENFNNYFNFAIVKDKNCLTFNEKDVVYDLRRSLDTENFEDKSLEEIINFFEEKNKLIKSTFTEYIKNLKNMENVIDLKNNFFNKNEKYKNFKKTLPKNEISEIEKNYNERSFPKTIKIINDNLEELLKQHQAIKDEIIRTKITPLKNQQSEKIRKIAETENILKSKNTEEQNMNRNINNLESKKNRTTDEEKKITIKKEEKNKLITEIKEQENFLSSEKNNLSQIEKNLKIEEENFIEEKKKLDEEFIIKKTEYIEEMFFQINFTSESYFNSFENFSSNNSFTVFKKTQDIDLSVSLFLKKKNILIDQKNFSDDFKIFLGHVIKINFLIEKFNMVVDNFDIFFRGFREIFFDLVSDRNIVLNIKNKILRGEKIFDLKEENLKNEIVVGDINISESDDYYLFDEMKNENDFYRIYFSKLFFLDTKIAEHNEILSDFKSKTDALLKSIRSEKLNLITKKIIEKLSIEEIILQKGSEIERIKKDFIFIFSTKKILQLKIYKKEEKNKTIKYNTKQKAKNNLLLEKYSIDFIKENLRKKITRTILDSNYIERKQDSSDEEESNLSSDSSDSEKTSSSEMSEEKSSEGYSAKKKREKKNDRKKSREEKLRKSLLKEIEVDKRVNKMKFFTKNNFENKTDDLYKEFIMKLGLKNFVDSAQQDKEDYYCVIGTSGDFLNKILI